MTEGTTTLQDGTRVRIEGSGPDLVLIHGVGMDLGMWDLVAQALRRQHRVIRYDMQGHGGSAKPRGPYRLADFVAQLARLTDALDLGPFALVGFSMGGLVAQGFALSHPERLAHLVLLNTVYARSRDERLAIAARVQDVRNGNIAPGVEAAIERWFTPPFRAKQADSVEAVRRHMLANDLDAYAAAYEVFATADAELVDAVARITCPTLVVTGADDRRSTTFMAEALAARIPYGRAEIIAGQRHMTPLEVPERLASMIAAFCREGGAVGSKAVMQ
jgi:3-oxoadipate enol-lactonase